MPLPRPVGIEFGDGVTLMATHRGVICISSSLESSSLYVPGASVSLISVGQLDEDGYSSIFAQQKCIVADKNNIAVLKVNKNPLNNLYEICLNCNFSSVFKACNCKVEIKASKCAASLQYFSMFGNSESYGSDEHEKKHGPVEHTGSRHVNELKSQHGFKGTDPMGFNECPSEKHQHLNSAFNLNVKLDGEISLDSSDCTQLCGSCQGCVDIDKSNRTLLKGIKEKDPSFGLDNPLNIETPIKYVHEIVELKKAYMATTSEVETDPATLEESLPNDVGCEAIEYGWNRTHYGGMSKVDRTARDFQKPRKDPDCEESRIDHEEEFLEEFF